MNIFFTNKDYQICAKDHCKIHTRKMIVEYTQLLSTAHHILDGDKAIEGIYKATHKNHPCAIWVRSDRSAYKWVLWLATELCIIYEKASGKTHACEPKLWNLRVPPKNMTTTIHSVPPSCMPDEYKIAGDVEGSYKKYLNSKYKEWYGRDKPLDVSWYGDKPDWVDC